MKWKIYLILKNYFLRLIVCSGDYLPNTLMARCDIDIVIRYYLFGFYKVEINQIEGFVNVTITPTYSKYLGFYFNKRLKKMKNRIKNTRAVCISFSYT